MVVRFTPGQEVWIPCEIQPGAFVGERFISVDVNGVELSGFVQEQDLEISSQNRGFVLGRVVDVSELSVDVNIQGSFFTTTGVAAFSTDWAAKNISIRK